MKILRLLLVSGLCSLITAQNLRADEGPVLTVEVKNILLAKGNLMVGIFNNAGTFTKEELPESPMVPVKETGVISVEVKGLKAGKYAVVVFQDFNENGKLDKNFLGMPKEPYAFSNDPEISRSAPKFSDCTFELEAEGTSLSLTLSGK